MQFPEHSDPFEVGGNPSAALPHPSSYGASAYGNASYGGASFGRYPSPYGPGYSSYGGIGGVGMAGMGGLGGYGGGRHGGVIGDLRQAQAGSAAVVSGMQEAMQRFARVSGLLEEVLRNVHLLFDGVFGLGYSLGAFQDEARMWLAVKSGPVAFALRLLSGMRRLWRLLVLFFCSPMAGRFSPVALVLRIVGVAPDDSSFVVAEDEATAPTSFARGDTLDSAVADYQTADFGNPGPSSM
jgi:hypothetical protein